MSDFTTIQVSKKVKKELDKLKFSKRDTYNQVIEELIEDTLELSDQAKKDIKEALEDIKKGRVYTQEEIEKEFGI